MGKGPIIAGACQMLHVVRLYLLRTYWQQVLVVCTVRNSIVHTHRFLKGPPIFTTPTADALVKVSKQVIRCVGRMVFAAKELSLQPAHSTSGRAKALPGGKLYNVEWYQDSRSQLYPGPLNHYTIATTRVCRLDLGRR